MNSLPSFVQFRFKNVAKEFWPFMDFRVSRMVRSRLVFHKIPASLFPALLKTINPHPFMRKSRVICVIMGGGRGTRLHPLTQQRCKPAVPLAGKYRLVDIPISNCLNSGLNQIHVLTQFNTASLHRHIQSTYQFDPFGGGFVEILSAEQTEGSEHWYQGTADAVRQNLRHFSANPNDLFLILSGDQLYRMDFRKIIEQHRELKADVTIAAIPVNKSEVSGLGVMKVNQKHEIEAFAEKPKDQALIDSLVIGPELKQYLQNPKQEDVCLASMGIYVFNANVLAESLENEMTDFGREVIPSLLGRRKLCSYIFDGYWEDIGTVGAFFEANLALTDPLPPFNFFDEENPIYTRARYLPATKFNQCNMTSVLSGGGSIVSRSTLKRCVIGLRSIIGEDCHFENVITMGSDFYENDDDREYNRKLGRPNIGIGRGCRIENAIIDKNARIGDDVHLSPRGKPDLWQAPGIFVRDGVLIVTKNATIASGTRIWD